MVDIQEVPGSNPGVPTKNLQTLNLPEEIFAELLDRWPVARLSTVSAAGRPHVVPIVFCKYGRFIYSPLDGKRKRSAQLKRFANIATNPQATLLLDQYTPDWQSLWWVRIDGDADWFEPDTQDAEHIARRLLEKYPQYQDPTLMFDTTAYLRLRPTKISAWAQTGLPETIKAAVESSRA